MTQAELCPPQCLPSQGTDLQSQLLFMFWCQLAPGSTQGCTGKGRRSWELLPRQSQSGSGRLSLGSSDSRNLHWSALVIWKRDTGEVATFTENISYARVEMRTRTEHFRFVCSQAAGQRQSSARARQAAHSPPQVPGRLLPASTQEDTRFLGITTPVPSSDPPISQVRVKTGKARKVLKMGVTTGPEELCNSGQASFSLDKQQP